MTQKSESSEHFMRIANYL